MPGTEEIKEADPIDVEAAVAGQPEYVEVADAAPVDDVASLAPEWTVTQDRADAPVPRGGRTAGSFAVAVARRSWRWLTSMRTALILLFLLAIAAIPGSLLPQTKTNPEDVTNYYQAHPKLAPIIGHIGGFAVFSSAWFSAIYLLLFISLIGCVLPRLRVYYQALRRQPPDAPARLSRMPVHTPGLSVAGEPAEAAATVRDVLRKRNYRAVIRSHDDGTVTVSAEKGYLKEAGNLLFHFSLIILLFGVAYGSWFGWHGDRILIAGTQFCSTPSEFNDYSPGARVQPSDIEPFCLSLSSFSATYTSAGVPSLFKAVGSYDEGTPGSPSHPTTIEVNQPLRLPAANVYLTSHGYAVILKFTDKYGHTQTSMAPFLPVDGDFTSDGAVTFPDANVDPTTGSNTDPKTYVKEQVGFSGVYVPTASDGLATSVFPAENDPVLVLTPYVGDLGLDAGRPMSVYSIDQTQIDNGQLKPLDDSTGATMLRLKPGQTAKLADGSSVQFVGTRQWASLALRYDPGEKIVLLGAILLVIGLVGSLTGRRRRVFVRLSRSGSTVSGEAADVSDAPTTTAEAGGLARAEYGSFPAEFASIVTAIDPGADVQQQERNARGNALP